MQRDFVHTYGQREVPRRCVVIKKSRVGRDVEKVELRYVAYNHADKDGKFSQLDILSDASNFIRERGKKMTYAADGVGGAMVTVASESTERHVTDVVSPAPNSGGNIEYTLLCRALPVLQKLYTRFRELEVVTEDDHRRCEYRTLREMTELALVDANRAVSQGHHAPSGLLAKIQGINAIAHRVLNEPAAEPLQDDSRSDLARSRTETDFK